MNDNLLKAEIRAKLTMRIEPDHRDDEWYSRWVETLDRTTEGIMEVLGKYDIKERVNDGRFDIQADGSNHGSSPRHRQRQR
jgi:hypothetical protein